MVYRDCLKHLSKGQQAYSKVAQQSPLLETEFLNNGVRPVSFPLTPFYDIFTKGKEIKVPEDLKGFKLRASGGVFTETLNYALEPHPYQ